MAALDRRRGRALAAQATSAGVEALQEFDAGPGSASSLRSIISAQHTLSDADHWIPFASTGDVFGGALIWNSPTGPTPPCPAQWITATARILAHVREQEERLRNAKLAALAEFAAGAGHEINNPLGSIIICAETLLRGETDPERRRLLATIGGQAYRIRDMIGDVMLFARPPKPDPQDLDLAATARHVISRFAEQAAERRITVGGDHAAPVLVQADRVQLAIVVSELLRNALQAVEDGGIIRVDARPASEAADSGGVLIVADNGRGLSEVDREHLFDPFYSGREAGRGLGFGLSKCWRIVAGHGGRIDVAENDGPGMTFTVRWPRPRAEDASQRAGDGVL